MEYTTLSCEEFTERLATKSPTPGGGGASALVGAIGIALGSMVGSLTLGKKKYAAVEKDILALQERAEGLRQRLLKLVEEDATAFRPLAEAYGMPRDTKEEQEEKDRVMEEALKAAGEVPLEIMKVCCEAIELLEEYQEKGSVIAVSDAGVGAALCRSALEGASLNVFINTKSMKDTSFANQMNEQAEKLLQEYGKRAERLFLTVKGRLI